MILQFAKYQSVLEEAITETAPQKLLTYLIDLARESNSWYAKERVVGNAQNESLAYKVKSIISDGLGILGFYVPERM